MSSREGESLRPQETGPAINRALDGLGRRVSRGDFSGLPVIIALLLIVAFFQSQNANFLSPRNLSNLALQISVTGTLAIGVVLVLLAGEIDLSIGSVMGLSAGVLVVLVASQDMPWWFGILVMAAVALCIGAVQGLWVTRFYVPSFIVTLAGLLIWFGVQLIVLGGQTGVNVRDQHILSLANSYLSAAEGWLLVIAAAVVFGSLTFWGQRRRVQGGGVALKSNGELVLRLAMFTAGLAFVVFVLNLWRGVPTAAIILVGLLIAFDVLTRRTQFGRHIYAIGGNRESSRRAGINVRRTVVAVMMLSSLMAAAAGLMATSRLSSAGTLTGGGTQMIEAIGAAVIGGTSLYGGRGTVWAALFGALVMGSVSNGLDLMGQRAEVKFVTQGAILLAAITIDTYSRRRLAAAGM